jgi:hypothetical protein
MSRQTMSWKSLDFMKQTVKEQVRVHSSGTPKPCHPESPRVLRTQQLGRNRGSVSGRQASEAGIQGGKDRDRDRATQREI